MLEKTFRPGDVETRLYQMWEDAGAFRPAQNSGAGNFCIVIPPPNVTGSLHLGHALNNTLQDVGSSRVDLQACKLEYSIVSPK